MESCRLYFVLTFCLLFSAPKINAQSGERNLLLPGATLEQAGQALDEILQNLADASQVELTRKVKQPDQEFPGNLTMVTTRLESSCNYDQLVRFLDAIRSYDNFLKIEELSITNFLVQGKWEIRPSLKVSGFVENAPDKVRAQAQDLEKRVDGAGALLFRRDQNFEILKELTGLLPPDAILTNYHNRDCKIVLSGLFPPSSSSDLMGKLEKSPFLKDLTSPGSTFLDLQSGKERVTFSAKCEK